MAVVIAYMHDHAFHRVVLDDHLELAGVLAVGMNDYVAARFGDRQCHLCDPVVTEVEPFQIDPQGVSHQRDAFGVCRCAELKTTADHLHFTR